MALAKTDVVKVSAAAGGGKQSKQSEGVGVAESGRGKKRMQTEAVLTPGTLSWGPFCAGVL